eukprot:14201036-Alexandrium_andersonii.AAC.1
MSASLVGSEMCIRDSASLPLPCCAARRDESCGTCGADLAIAAEEETSWADPGVNTGEGH